MLATILNAIYRHFVMAGAVHRKPRGKAMTEAIAGLCVLLSASIFLAHAFDAYRMR